MVFHLVPIILLFFYSLFRPKISPFLSVNRVTRCKEDMLSTENCEVAFNLSKNFRLIEFLFSASINCQGGSIIREKEEFNILPV